MNARPGNGAISAFSTATGKCAGVSSGAPG
jgi:hypothetical protein